MRENFALRFADAWGFFVDFAKYDLDKMILDRNTGEVIQRNTGEVIQRNTGEVIQRNTGEVIQDGE
ncbi:MAG: hypothetical protein ACRC80_29470 [Waterburya sp.]